MTHTYTHLGKSPVHLHGLASGLSQVFDDQTVLNIAIPVNVAHMRATES